MRFVPLTLRIPLEVVQAIEARAQVTGASKAEVVVERLTKATALPLMSLTDLSTALAHYGDDGYSNEFSALQL